VDWHPVEVKGGLKKNVAVAEAAQAHFARAKNSLREAVECKLREQAGYVVSATPHRGLAIRASSRRQPNEPSIVA
jgi:hypothetical protein